MTDVQRRLSTTLSNRPTIGVRGRKEARGAHSICAQPAMMPAVLVRRHDAHPMWTRVALFGLLAALLLAIFGMPPVDLHGLLHYVGVVDPFCGGTRSGYLALPGPLRDAVRSNPARPAPVRAGLAPLP